MWNNLTPSALSRRSEVVMQFGRQMGGDFSESFHLGEKLSDLLGNADPSTVDNAMEEARKAVRDGGLSQDRAVERLMSAFGKDASGNNASRLATLFRRALASDKPIGRLFAEMEQADSEIPDAQSRESMAYCRQQHALQFRREHGVELPADEFIPDGELDRAVKLMDRRKGLSFDRALTMVRTGR